MCFYGEFCSAYHRSIACWTEVQIVEDYPTCICREKMFWNSNLNKKTIYSNSFASIFLAYLEMIFFLVGLSGLLNLLVFIWSFALGIFLQENNWSDLRKANLHFEEFLLWKVLFKWCGTPDILLGNHTVSWGLSCLGSFQYTGPRSTRNNYSYLSISFLDYLCSYWRRI